MIIYLAICLLLLAAAYILVPANKYKNTYFSLAFIAVLIRIVMVSYLYSNGTDTFGTDGLLYHKEGIKVATQLAQGIPFFSVKYSYTWYTVLVGLIYHIFGVNRYIVSYINIIITLYTAILLLKVALNHNYSFKNAAFISVSFLYFPNLILWTADSRKEALLIFLSILCWYNVQHFIIAIENKKYNPVISFARMVLVCVLIWLCTLVRIYMFVPLGAGIIISMLLQFRKDRSYLSILYTLVILASSLLIFFAAVNPLTQDYHAVEFSKEAADSISTDLNTKFATVKTIASSRNILTSIVKYLILPYPGLVEFADIHGNNSAEMIVSLDMIAWYFCLVMMLTGIYTAVKKKDSFLLGLLAFISSYIIINALVVENVSDTIYRYRSVIIGTSLLFINLDVLNKFLLRFKNLTGIGDGAIKPGTAHSYSRFEYK